MSHLLGGEMCKLLMMIACCALFSIPAVADPVTVGYSTTGAGPFTFEADNFSLTGQTGFLTLDTVSSTTTNINTALFFTGNSGSFIGTQTFALTYDLTLDGVTQSVTQMATWTISPALDTFVTAAGSSPVLFDTPAGRWSVTLGAYSVVAVPSDIGTTQIASTSADFAVPEPGAIALFTSSLLMLRMLPKKRVQSQV